MELQTFKARSFLGAMGIRAGLIVIALLQIGVGAFLFMSLKFLRPSLPGPAWFLLSINCISAIIGIWGLWKRNQPVEIIYLATFIVGLGFLIMVTLCFADVVEFLPPAPKGASTGFMQLDNRHTTTHHRFHSIYQNNNYNSNINYNNDGDDDNINNYDEDDDDDTDDNYSNIDINSSYDKFIQNDDTTRSDTDNNNNDINSNDNNKNDNIYNNNKRKHKYVLKHFRAGPLLAHILEDIRLIEPQELSSFHLPEVHIPKVEIPDYEHMPFVPHGNETAGETSEVGASELPPEMERLNESQQDEVIAMAKMQKRPFKLAIACALSLVIVFEIYCLWIISTFIMNKCMSFDEMIGAAEQFAPLVGAQ